MTHKRNALDRLSERVVDLDSPAYGDERERAVSMESNVFGLTTGIYLSLLVAVLSALFGLLLLPVTLLTIAILSAIASVWYAKQREVSVNELAEKSGARSTMTNFVISGAAMMMTFAALTYTIYTGQAVLPTPTLQVTAGEGFIGGMAEGAPIGGMLGGLAVIIGGIHSYRRANRTVKEE